MSINESKTNRKQQKHGRLLVKILRHNPESVGVNLDDEGYAPLDTILTHHKFAGVTIEQVQQIVQNCDKQRMHMKQDANGNWLIRANQGHSVKKTFTNLLDKITVPCSCVHGTNLAAWKNIKKSGLNRMRRQYIHMADAPTGVVSGPGWRATSKDSVIIHIDMAKAMASGLEFSRSKNGVICCVGPIPSTFFSKVEDVNGNDLLS